MRRWAGVLSLVLASVVCVAGAPARAQMVFAPGAAIVQEPVAPPPPIMVTLATEKVYYRPGEPVVMRLVVRNVGAHPVTLRYGSSQRYDFLVRHVPSGEVVWQWSFNRYFLWVLGAETLEPGETRIVMEEWRQQSNAGGPVRTGIYRLEALLPTYEPDPLPSNWTFITIGRRLF